MKITEKKVLLYDINKDPEALYKKEETARKRAKARFIIVYIIGCIVAYLYAKSVYIQHRHEWTIKDRAFFIVFSAGSWYTVAATAMIDLSKPDGKDYDDPAEW